MPVCPICGTWAGVLDTTGDADGFDCSRDGEFKVAGSVFAIEATKHAGREQWEAALKKAKARAKPNVWPTIMTHDF